MLAQGWVPGWVVKGCPGEELGADEQGLLSQMDLSLCSGSALQPACALGESFS